MHKMNLEEIINYKRPKETYYDILGCSSSSSVEQINREYKIKALEYHPDKNSDPESLEKFRQIQAAKEVLTDEASRRSYDCWLNSRICIPFEQWKDKKGHSMHWVSPRATNLSIKHSSSTGQGSDFESVRCNNNQHDKNTSEWLEKFRKYQI